MNRNVTIRSKSWLLAAVPVNLPAMPGDGLDTRGRRTRWAVRAAITVAALGVAALALCGAVPVDEARPVVSLLALGDTGAMPGWVPALGRQRAVGKALAHEDTRLPADALLLLGDNFYQNGLRRREVASRVRDNVVAPYCRFIDLAGARSDEVRGACAEGERRRPAPPIFVVLGNHDVSSEESRELETREVQRLVSNWQLSDAPAHWVALSPKLSLVLFDSNRLRDGGDPEPLRDAIRAAPGPWRILAAHHPIAMRGGSARDAYTKTVRRAVRDAGVPVQLMLAGHDHNLQVLALDGPGPRLVVVSGAGSRPRGVKTRSDGQLYEHTDLGFVRVDLLEEPGGERLRVTLFGADHWPSLLGFAPEVLGRWSLERDGALAVEPLAIRLFEAR